MTDWWESFFDEIYLAVWGSLLTPARTRAEVDAIWSLADLAPGSRVLDAPCGYGRISRELAARGAHVLGVDLAAAQLERAGRDRGDLPAERLRYLRHDLRAPLPSDERFDAALNVFSSLGYGGEADDLAVLRSLRAAIRDDGVVFVETAHLDAVARAMSRDPRPVWRFGDGTYVIETPRFDGETGRLETCWSWRGPAGRGVKAASLRIYTAGELVALAREAGLRVRSLHAGCTWDAFVPDGEGMSERLGLRLVAS
jgi:SAM-dependent methyltransferase